MLKTFIPVCFAATVAAALLAGSASAGSFGSKDLIRPSHFMSRDSCWIFVQMNKCEYECERKFKICLQNGGSGACLRVKAYCNAKCQGGP
jgi:hypothetical protein